MAELEDQLQADIAGIEAEFALQQQQIRRFAAHSWGELNKKSPIQLESDFSFIEV